MGGEETQHSAKPAQVSKETKNRPIKEQKRPTGTAYPGTSLVLALFHMLSSSPSPCPAPCAMRIRMCSLRIRMCSLCVCTAYFRRLLLLVALPVALPEPQGFRV